MVHLAIPDMSGNFSLASRRLIVTGILLAAAPVLSSCAGPRAQPAASITPLPSPTAAAPKPITADPSPTPAEAWPDAETMLARIGRGINLGNALDAPQEGDWEVTLKEEYFDRIQQAGFDSIRLPVRFHTHAGESAPYAIDPVFFQRVDWAIGHALDRGLAVVLDMHHFVPLMDCPECERDRFLSLWRQIGEHYREYPAGLMFELLNEPTNTVTADEWNSLLLDGLVAARENNPDRIVIVGPVNWNNLSYLSTLQLPEDDRRLIATFHYYEPFAFTHQGADWVTGSDAWLGTVWTGTDGEQAAVRRDFQIVSAWSAAHHRPILLGEFGSIVTAVADSRVRYTAFVAREAEARGFAWSYWEFCSGFGVYDPLLRIWQMPLLRALLPDSPPLVQ